jgi:hypothetical protein
MNLVTILACKKLIWNLGMGKVTAELMDEKVTKNTTLLYLVTVYSSSA